LNGSLNIIGFDFDMLGRLRGYDTDTRESTFNYDGTKRFGDFDDGWKRYHWCKSQFLGYEDEANTYYIVPDVNGSTKVIFTHAGTIANRLDYDTLGKIRNQDTTPQVELLWRGMFWDEDVNLYISNNKSTIYFPIGLSFGIIKAISGFIVYLPSLLNPLSLFRLPILAKNAYGFNGIPRGSDIINPGGGNGNNPLFISWLEELIDGGGCQGGWVRDPKNPDDIPYYFINPRVWYGQYECCLAYEIKDGRPTGNCAVWGDCIDGLY